MEAAPDQGEDSYVGHGKLTGLQALTSGGDLGIGRAVAVAFAREGADVAINYLPAGQRGVDDTIGWVREAGRVDAHVEGDLRQRGVGEQVAAALGGLDIWLTTRATTGLVTRRASTVCSSTTSSGRC